MTFLDSIPRLPEPPTIRVPDVFAPAVGKPDADGVLTLQLFHGGAWQPAETGEVFEVSSPIDGSLIARAQKAGKEDVKQAIAAAKRARSTMQRMPASERIQICVRAAEIMSRHADAFEHAIVNDLGKTPSSARTETDRTVLRLELVREEVRKIFGDYIPGDWVQGTEGKSGVVLREPLGTVTAIGPFNYPLFTPAAKIIPALAAGNSVVAKAPSDSPFALLMFARMLDEAGLPKGALNVVTGPGSEIGDLLASHEDISMVSFTGSTPVGYSLAAAAGPKPLHLELGGNAAAIVLADADPEHAAARTVKGAFNLAGQRCSAVSRVIVEEGLYDAYVERALEEVRTWVLGDPRAEGVDVGPLKGPDEATRVNDLVEDAVKKGAELLAGGEAADAYHQPSMLVDVPLDAEIVWEETFGPVLTVVRATDAEAAIEIANRSRYGLDGAVFTRDLEKAWGVAAALKVGMVAVNDAPSHGVGHFPFGGRTPDSGLGREGLGYSIDECTALKTVVLPT
ncbi:MAG: aldehyde dehydrogenase family protein [Actinomycetota bacterium]|nr:aldehyde dehydrogenase family protein [Actinomycetota bacterium]